MKRTLSLIVLAALAAAGAAAAPAGTSGDEAVQSAKATGFELKMRVLEGSRDRTLAPGRPVTSSFLEFLNFANFDSAEDAATEEQIKKVFSLKDLRLLTEAPLVWAKGKTDKAFHMFRLNGQEYLVMVTPGRLPEKNQFRIEVHEQGPAKKTSLLDTEFTLPEKTAAVFGFETTELKPYFITLRLARWLGEPAGAATVDVRGKGDEKVKPPKLVKEVEPVYPEAARKAGIEGVVILEGTTDTYGRVVEAKVLRGVPQLDQAAVDALKQWVYEPMVIDGKPQPVVFTVTVRFKLDDKKKPDVAGAVGGAVGGVLAGGAPAGKPDAQELAKFEGDAVRAVGEVEPPKVVKQVSPVYPETARQSRVEGVVILEAKTDEQGNVVDARVLRSVKGLDQAAIDAVKQWKYEPMVLDGKPRKALFTVTVRFVLDQGKLGMFTKEFAQGAVLAANEIKPPKVVKEVFPVYPEAARAAGVQGEVILGVRTDEQGRVVGAMVLKSVPLLDQAAIDAVRQWVYEPFLKDGKPTAVVFSVTVNFRLQ